MVGVDWLAHLVVRVLPLHLEVVLQLLFDALGGLKTVDQLQLFLLHTHHFLFVHHLLVLLALEFLFDLGFDSVLAFDHVEVALLGGLLLLGADELLHLLSTGFLGSALLLDAALDGLLLELGLVGLAARVVDRLKLLGLRPLVLLALCVVVRRRLGLLLGLLLLATRLLLLVHLVVALALADDFVRPLPRLLDFLNRLETVSASGDLPCPLQT